MTTRDKVGLGISILYFTRILQLKPSARDVCGNPAPWVAEVVHAGGIHSTHRDLTHLYISLLLSTTVGCELTSRVLLATRVQARTCTILSALRRVYIPYIPYYKTVNRIKDRVTEAITIKT